jgi:hypothetical protein
MSMWKLLKAHFATKKNFHKVRAESTFSIRIQDGTYFHLFTIKITEEGNLYTKFQVQSHVSKEVFKFIQRFDVDIPDHTYIPERDRYFMLVLNNELKWFGFSPFQHMTLSLYQAEKLMKQLYEIKYIQYCNVNQTPCIIESDIHPMTPSSSYPSSSSFPRENN